MSIATALSLLLLISGLSVELNARERRIIPMPIGNSSVTLKEMKEIYEQIRTPYKYGIVLRGDEGKLVDSPSVFRKGDSWYMTYICMNDVGYETLLAKSGDLLNWEKLGKILSFPKDGWDRWQCAGYMALVDHHWGATNEAQVFKGKYWMTYLGGALQGYETDPLATGVAWTKDAAKADEWTRFSGNPVLNKDQPDARWFEKDTIYKSCVIWDKKRTVGYPFVMFYNGKALGTERIGMAVSEDMKTWLRLGSDPVIDNQSGISGDPQIVKIGDIWVMFYFGAFWKPNAFDTFACSRDLVHWTKWTGPHLVEPSESWDKQFAHKPWVLKHDGVVYHFYCAVGDEGRVIALATSRELRNSKLRHGADAGASAL